MKTKILSLCLALVSSVGTLYAYGSYNFIAKVGDFYYGFLRSEKTARVMWKNQTNPDPKRYVGDIVVPASVTYNDTTYTVAEIGDAFRGCTNLTSVTIPNSVTYISGYAFEKCKMLKSVTLPPNIKLINTFTFSECSSLESIVIPENVIAIGQQAFYKCDSLKEIIMLPSVPPVINQYGISYYFTIPLTVNIHVPCGSMEAYMATDWGHYNLLDIPNSFKVNIVSSDSLIGKVSSEWVSNSACNPILSMIATPMWGSHFVQWNDGDTTNPRTINLTCDTSFTAIFAKNPTVHFLYDTTMGKVVGDTTLAYEASGNIIFEAVPNYGYHFVRWSDGNTTNPRTIFLSKDTTLAVDFAVDISGTCGKGNQLSWAYDDKTKTLLIDGSGELNENYTFGIEAPTQMQNLIIGSDVTIIGDSAFYAMTTIRHLSIGDNMASIGNYAFAECKNYDDITCYATTVPTINATTFANIGNKYYIYLYVPEDCQRAYKRDTYWSEFDIKPIVEATTVETNDVKVTPTDSSAVVAWPSITGAATYELVIKDQYGNVVCTLIFNAQGMLVLISFNAPSRSNAPQQAQADGFSFIVTGLEAGTTYDLVITAKDINDNTIEEEIISFTTTGDNQSIENVLNDSSAKKIVNNNNIYVLLPDGKKYSIIGERVE